MCWHRKCKRHAHVRVLAHHNSPLFPKENLRTGSLYVTVRDRSDIPSNSSLLDRY